jgi:hypothetical protein
MTEAGDGDNENHYAGSEHARDPTGDRSHEDERGERTERSDRH